MTILIAPDSFKGSLSASNAADAIELGIRRALPSAVTIKQAISDGGEGLVDVLVPALEGTFQTTEVVGPLPNQRVHARWGLSADRSTAVIEMAAAAGLPLVPLESRNPMVTTTYGVGEIIRVALDAGAQSIIMGIGGSATNDGGAGMAEALGVRFLDDSGKNIRRGGVGLKDLRRIDVNQRDERINRARFLAACDVQNYLCGEQGASAIFGPQKGATPEEVKMLDQALHQYGMLIESTLGLDVLSIPGGGAAGGLGAGLVAFCGARLMRGIDVVLDATHFDERLREADLVVTGEGKLDEQVRFGKALSGVVERARRFNVPVVAVVGSLEGERSAFVHDSFLAGLECLVDETTNAEQAMRGAFKLVVNKSRVLLNRYLARSV